MKHTVTDNDDDNDYDHNNDNNDDHDDGNDDDDHNDDDNDHDDDSDAVQGAAQREANHHLCAQPELEHHQDLLEASQRFHHQRGVPRLPGEHDGENYHNYQSLQRIITIFKISRDLSQLSKSPENYHNYQISRSPGKTGQASKQLTSDKSRSLKTMIII